ncbi:hypothetical protein PGT21_032729 [Puccinia graminis f. sp. tritici]|uniref:Uncharacterized protein n=1 Tax=Puccinia graminis f. sp. tritici TaxID=56615 RepID=A0A5B0MGP3_PUCGR|nr:hypothetical protein PGT21_032729 [Puccinia graminis f. sp. tritici]
MEQAETNSSLDQLNPINQQQQQQPITTTISSSDSSDSSATTTATTTITSSPEGSSPSLILDSKTSSTDQSNSSTPTPLPAPSTTPPIPTSNLKKFKASSLSVNKKFLSQSTTADGKLAKNYHHSASPRLSSLTSSSSPGTPGSAPRLLTGKIGLNNSILNSTGSGGSGWAKTSLLTSTPLSLTNSKSPELSHPNPPILSHSYSTDSQNRPEDGHPSSKTPINAFLHAHSTQPYPPHHTTHPINKSPTPSSSSPSATTTPTTTATTISSTNSSSTIAPSSSSPSLSSSSPWVKLGNSTRGGINNLATDFPTAQEVAQHTKLKAQSMAAAVAARDKVVQDRAAASAAYNQQLLQTLDGFRGTHLDPNASHWDEMEDEDDMFGEVVEFGDGTQYKVTEVVPPAADPATSLGNETVPSSGLSQAQSHKARLPEDYRRSHHQLATEENDSMPPFLRGRAELKSLFNERIGKFEPYSGKPNEKTKDHHPQVQLLQRQRDVPNDIPSSTPHSTRLPNSTGPNGKSTDINSTQPHRPSSHQPDSNNFIPPSRTSLSQPLSPPIPSRTSAPPAPSAPVKAPGNVSEAADKQPTAPDTSNQAPKYRKPDLDQVHRSEMTSAAERARKRRQEEEAARESEKERAKLKAAEIEARLKAAADAAKVAAEAAKAAADAKAAEKAAEKAAALEASAKKHSKNDSSPKLLLRPSSNDPPRSSNTTRSDSKDSWRRPPSHQSEDRPKSMMASPKSTPAEAVVVKLEAATRPLGPLAENSINPESSGRPMPKTSRPSDQPSCLPSQEEAFKRRSEDVSSRSLVWKPKIASAPASQVKVEDRQTQQTAPSDQSSKPITIQKRLAPSAPTNEDRWRPSQDNASKPASRADTRQLPPHIQPDNLKASEPAPAPKTVSSQPEARPASRPSPDIRSSPPASLPSHTSPNMSTGTLRSLAPDKKAGFKLPEMSHLDTVMSRIKVVLEADKEARAKAAVVATTPKESSTDSRSINPPPSSNSKDAPKPTPTRQGSDHQLKEPSSSLQGQPSSSPTAVYIAGRPRTLLPRTIETPIIVNTSSETKPSSHSASPAPLSSSTSVAPPRIPSTSSLAPALSNPALKKPSSVRKAARFDIPTTVESKPTAVSTPSLPPSAPRWVKRDPIVFFDATRQERPSSPGPAWKAFTVKFGAATPKPRLASHIIKSFWNPLVPTKVNVLTWDPPMANLSPRTLSRDDLLFRKKYIRGVVVSHVQFPKNSISSLATKAQSALSNASELVPRDDGSSRAGRGRGAAPTGSRGRGRGRADETTSWRRPVEEEKTPAAIAQSVLSTTDSTPTRSTDLIQSPTTAPSSEPVKSSESQSVRRSKAKIPDGLKVAFHKPAHLLSSTSSSSGMFMVHSEITGEGAQSSQDPAPSSCLPKPTSPTSSTTQNTIPKPLTPPVATPTRSSSIACMSGSKGSTSPWTKSPLAFSVLDSHTKNVWSQPDGQITGQPLPSGKTENSLEGITDDFPATLPRTLNDFNAVEEPSSSSSHHHQPVQYSTSSSRKSSELPGPGKREQNGGSPSNLQMSSNNNSDDQPKANGLAQHPYLSSPGCPPQYNNETPSSNSGHMYGGHHGFSSPTNFQVPPGYQLVPIGSLPSNQANQPYPSNSGIYPGPQSVAPWSPSPGPIQPNGYARSPQLPYSPNTSYPSPLTSASYPSHSHTVGPSPISDGPSGFSKSPGPIAPRGSRVSLPTSSHLARLPNEFTPTTVHRNYPTPPSASSKAQTGTGHSYHLSAGSLDGPSVANHSAGGPTAPSGYPEHPFGPFHPPTGLPVHQQQQPPPSNFNQAVHHGSGPGGQASHLAGPRHHQIHHQPHAHNPAIVAGPPLPPHASTPTHHYIPHAHPFHHPALQHQAVGPPPPSNLLPGGPGPGHGNHHPGLSYPANNNHPYLNQLHHHPQQQQQQQIAPHQTSSNGGNHRTYGGHIATGGSTFSPVPSKSTSGNAHNNGGTPHRSGGGNGRDKNLSNQHASLTSSSTHHHPPNMSHLSIPPSSSSSSSKVVGVGPAATTTTSGQGGYGPPRR